MAVGDQELAVNQTIFVTYYGQFEPGKQKLIQNQQICIQQ